MVASQGQNCKHWGRREYGGEAINCSIQHRSCKKKQLPGEFSLTVKSRLAQAPRTVTYLDLTTLGDKKTKVKAFMTSRICMQLRPDFVFCNPPCNGDISGRTALYLLQGL